MSDGLTKRGSLFNVPKQSDKVIFKKKAIVYQNKVISKKKDFNFGGAIFDVPKQCDLQKGL